MERHNMQVAILMASYNGEKYIKEQLDSIVGQTFTGWKLYINDDGSKDKTVDIIQEYISRYPDKIFLSKNDSGVHGSTPNFADLFKKVPKADWYAFCDQDDVWFEDRLEKMLRGVMHSEGEPGNEDGMAADEKETSVLIYGKAMVVGEELNKISDSIEECMNMRLVRGQEKRQMILANYVYGCTMMINHSLRLLLGEIPEAAVFHDFYIAQVAAYLGEIRYVDEYVVKYRQHGDNASAGVNTFWKDVLGRLRDFKGLIGRIKALKRRTVEQAEYVIDRYDGMITESDKKAVADCISLVRSKRRLHSLVWGKMKGYYGYKGCSRFVVCFFVF